ncbi:MAG TPA: DUF3300 domain-containing protein [Bryobacteraceae bacterium]|nr:DUF3300 domain-containing protein [Bryobacteraceae bacterium]
MTAAPEAIWRQVLAVGLSLAIAASSSGYQNPEPTSGTDAGGAADAAPTSASELEALVAPIALYPDALVAQILAAATFPDQVAIADYWLQQNQRLKGTSLMQAVDKQSWDVSVKALTEFPTVLGNLAKNLTWTSSLGEAYHNQAPEVMAAIQTLRAQAKAAGNLKSNSQITVVQETPQTIVIEPANPQVVYVPIYNPAVIYGTPYVTPGYTAGEMAAAGVIGFGAGIALGALAGGGCCGWGWNSWNCNWGGGAVVYNHNNFYGNTAWHGGYYNGGYHDGYGYHNAYNRAEANNFRGSANRVSNLNREADRNFEANRAGSWAHDESAFGRSNAFSGLGDRFGGLGGWESRAHSFRGWGSMRAGGFFGGRFGGGGFGGGHFGGFHGGFRR